MQGTSESVVATMSVSRAVFERSRNVRWGFVFLFAVLFALGGCGGGSSDRERTVDPTPDPDILSLSAPVLDGALVAGVQRDLQVGYRFDQEALGDELFEIRFSLEEGPTGMVLFEEIGTLRWTPSLAHEGTEPRVRVAATVGDVTEEIAFTVPVALSTPLATRVVGNTLMVTQPGSLEGFAITVAEDASLPASQMQVRVVDEDRVAPPPSAIIRVSDFFRMTPAHAQHGYPITVALPRTMVPDTVDPARLTLFTFQEGTAIPHPDRVSEYGDSASWASTGANFELTNDTFTFDVAQTGPLSFIGYYPAAPVETRPVVPANASTQGRCSVDVYGIVARCRAEDFQVEIRYQALDNWSEGWIQERAELIFAWLLQAREYILRWDMTLPTPFPTVFVEPLLDSEGNVRALGEVRWPDRETDEEWWIPRIPTVHIHQDMDARSRGTLTAKQRASTVVHHEAFHVAQGNVPNPGHFYYLLDSGRLESNWILEGMAVWFEDEVQDHLDSYRAVAGGTDLPPFLTRRHARGLGNLLSEAEGYQYFGWWKMIHHHCPGFSPRDLFLVRPEDRWGLENFQIRLSHWSCSFPFLSNVGRISRERNLADALLYYAYATHHQTSARSDIDSFRLLDPSEPGNVITFQSVTASLRASEACTELTPEWWESCPSSAWEVGAIGRAAVNVIDVDWLLLLPPAEADRRTAMFHVRNLGTNSIYLFLSQQSGAAGGWPTGKGFEIPASNEFVTIRPSEVTGLRTPYDGEWSVFLVNPSVSDEVLYEVLVGIEEDTFYDPGRIEGRYDVVGADGGIVRDVVTGLEWQRCAVGQTWNPSTGRCDGWGSLIAWDDAVRETAPGGFRLPTDDELRTLVYCSSGSPALFNETGSRCLGAYTWPTIVVEAFPDTPADGFWSGTPSPVDPERARIMGFFYGEDRWEFKHIRARVRLVRLAP